MSDIDRLLRNQLSSVAGDKLDEQALWTDIVDRVDRRQRARRKRRRLVTFLCVALFLFLSAGIGALLAGSTSPHASKVVDPEAGPGGFTVTPNTGLVNHQKVAISIHGLRPDSTIWIDMCVGRPTSYQQGVNQCKAPATMVNLDAKGAADVHFVVDRYLSPGGYEVDCATYTAGCSVALVDPMSISSDDIVGNFQPVTFQDTTAPSPNPLRISVLPTAPFADGQVLTVSGSGFPSTSPIRVGECPTNTDCGSYFQNIVTSPDGTFSVPITLHRTYTVEQGTVSGGEKPVTIDCSQPLRCFLMAEEATPPYSGASSIPLTFTPPG